LAAQDRCFELVAWHPSRGQESGIITGFLLDLTQAAPAFQVEVRTP
jgi:hypothetical protein